MVTRVWNTHLLSKRGKTSTGKCRVEDTEKSKLVAVVAAAKQRPARVHLTQNPRPSGFAAAGAPPGPERCRADFKGWSASALPPWWHLPKAATAYTGLNAAPGSLAAVYPAIPNRLRDSTSNRQWSLANANANDYQDAASDVSRLNREAATRAVKVHAHTYCVLAWAAHIAHVSHGIFDVSIAGRLAEWGILAAPKAAQQFDPSATFRDVELLPGRCVRFKRPLWLDLSGTKVVLADPTRSAHVLEHFCAGAYVHHPDAPGSGWKALGTLQ
jgi:hypothetical protein